MFKKIIESLINKDKIDSFIKNNRIQVILIKKHTYKESNQDSKKNIYSITLVNNYNFLHFIVSFNNMNIHDILKNTFNISYIDEVKIVDTINYKINHKVYKKLCDSTFYLDLDYIL